jgi:YfiH family protein
MMASRGWTRSYMTLPPVPDDFYWTEEGWGAALHCRPLAALAPHLFTTRQLELSSAAGELRMAAAIGASRAVLLTQVHGAGAVVLRAGEPLPEGRPEADVLVSNRDDVAVAVRAADCVPMLFADRATGAVAAVHAGWRGTATRAAVAAVERLGREFGSRVADLVVAIGPSIGPCCYEVGTELVDAFAAAGHERYLIDRWFPALPPPRGSRQWPKLRLDLALANRDQLILAGVPEQQIHAAGLCTAMHLDVLTSYRMEKERAGRLAAAIVCRR